MLRVMSEHVHVEDAAAVRYITMAKPERRNALSRVMYTAMAQALDAADRDPAIRAIVLRGAGGTFTAGNDLADFLEHPDMGETSPAVVFLRRLIALTKPLVASVEGPAIGIGTTMLLHCDVVVAAQTSKFHLPFVELALVPEAGATLMLPLGMGHRLASELLLLAEPFDAPRARELGIVNRVVPADRLAAEVEAVVQRFVSLPPAALAQTKRLLRRPTTDTLADRIDQEVAAFRERLRSDELKERIAAFFEKRGKKS